MDNLKDVIINILKDPLTGWFNPAHDAKIRNDYFKTTGAKLPDVAKVEKFDPKVVEPINNRGIGWYTKVNIPASSRQINSNQYMVPRSKIVIYSPNNKAPIKILGGKIMNGSPNAMILGGGLRMLNDKLEYNKAIEDSKNRIQYLKDFHTGPAYISYPDTREGRESRWAAEQLRRMWGNE